MSAIRLNYSKLSLPQLDELARYYEKRAIYNFDLKRGSKRKVQDEKTALSIAKFITKRFPKSPTGWLLMGRLCVPGDVVRAVTFYKKALRLSPKEDRNYLYKLISSAYEQSGDHAKAEHWQVKAILLRD